MNKHLLSNLIIAMSFSFLVIFTNTASAGFDPQLNSKLEIKLVSSAPAELLPGSIVNLSFLLTNNSDSAEELVEQLALPEGFIALLPPGTMSIGPFKTKPSQISVRILRGTPAGKHEITYSLESSSTPGRKASAKTALTVSLVKKLTIITEEKPDNIIAGDSFQVKVRLFNAGNAEVNALLKADSGKNFHVKVEPKNVSLPPGQGISVLMDVTTNIGAKRIETLFITLQALDFKLRAKPVLESIAIGIEKIPKAYGDVDLHRRIPAKMKLRNHGEGAGEWSQIEISGAGSLNESGNKRIDFLLRTPDQKMKSLFGLSDEFRFNYATDDFSLRAGDESYSLSYLTNYFTYGRGLELNFNKSKPTRFGFFHLDSRWEDPRRTQFGIYVGHDVTDKINLKVNHFKQDQRGFAGSNGQKKNITSLEVDCTPDERSRLNFELGQSAYSSGLSQNDHAYRIQYIGDFARQVRITLDKIRADPNYAGPVRDMDHSLGTLSFPILSWVHGRVRYSQYEQNLGFDPKRGAATLENLWQFGFNFQLRYGINLAVDLDRLNRYDQLLPANFDSREKAYRAMISKNWKRFDLRWEVRHSRQTESVGGQETWNDSHNYYAAYRPSRKFFFSVYGGFSNNQGNQFSFILRDFNNIGIISRWMPTERLSLSYWYLKYDYSGIQNENSLGSFGIEYQLRNCASIVFNAKNHVSWATAKGPTFYELVYSIPINIPIGKNTRIGNLAGKVIDAQLPGKPPMQKVVLIMGGTAAITDKGGNFVFPALTCGTYTLRIEKQSVGLNRISSIKMPAEIQIKGGETIRVMIEMRKGAQLKGKFVRPSEDHKIAGTSKALILIGDSQPVLQKRPAISMANILIELSNEEETVRRVTDNDGEFFFDALNPGLWHYKIYEQNIPENHYIKNTNGEITVGSEKITNISFEVLARQRRIKIVDEGKLELPPA